MKGIVYALLLSASLLITGCAVSDAGSDQVVTSGQTVTLDGSGSSSTEGRELSFYWRQLSGPTVALENADSDKATFVAPTVTSETAMRFALMVTEAGTYSRSMDTVLVTVKPAPVATGVTVSGVVTDTNSTPISGATVKIGNVEVVTDANGTYEVTNVTEAQRVSINVSHPDYLKNSRIVDVEDKDVSQDITLDTPKATLTFLSDEGGIVSEDDGAKVELPAGGYIDGNGQSYTGDVVVKMSYHPTTTRSGRATFPGTFEGVDANGTAFPIQSYGFMNVELTDPQGNPLNLDGNTTATLTFPVDSSVYGSSVIPLWYYDEALGYWVQEGEAITQDWQTYTGTVTHFTSWNLDAKGAVARYTGCVEDENGTKLSNATVQFRALNWDSYKVHTDENGTISVYNILANSDLTFSASHIIGSTLYTGSKHIYLNEGDDVVDTECAVLKPVATFDGNYTVTGTVYSYDYYNEQSGGENVPVPNAQVMLYDKNHNIVGVATTDSQGKYTLSFTPNDSLKYYINASSNDYGSGSNGFILQENQYSYEVNIQTDTVQLM